MCHTPKENLLIELNKRFKTNPTNSSREKIINFVETELLSEYKQAEKFLDLGMLLPVLIFILGVLFLGATYGGIDNGSDQMTQQLGFTVGGMTVIFSFVTLFSILNSPYRLYMKLKEEKKIEQYNLETVQLKNKYIGPSA